MSSDPKKPATPERKVIDLTDPPAVEHKASAPLIQNSQRCPWCRQYLLYGDVVETYRGSDSDFKGWECHAECNANYLLPKKLDFIDLTDS